jgi:aminoglycoside phosphotransferase (APT) family kinase protein
VSGWLETLERYVASRLPHASALSLRPGGALPAGASNTTIPLDLSFECDGVTSIAPLILRPERQGGILAPYDVARQFKIMRALAPTEVPVPAVFWLERDPDILGVPFYLMARLPGVRTPPLFWYQPSPLVDAASAALARVHGVDWRAAGLSSLLEDAASPLANEMAAWAPRARNTRALEEPIMHRLQQTLLANEPSDATFALVHGDTNAGNYLFRGSEVAAVVDWELATIGDPRSDLGFYAALEWFFGGGGVRDGHSLLSEGYERVTGASLRDLPFYEAWGLYRMMVIFGGRGMWNPYGIGAALERLDEILGRDWRR